MYRDKKYSPIFGSTEWLKRKEFPQSQGEKTINLIDLFCGCGGFSLGAMEAASANNINLRIDLAIDLDKDCIEVYKNNINNAKVFNKDICEILPGNIGAGLSFEEKQLQRKIGKIDIILAGPPCQGHSNLNNKTRRNDPRNQLYLKVIRAIEVLKPKIAIIENVTAIKFDKSGLINKSEEFLTNLGYKVELIEINARNFNVAQNRKRLLLVAYNLVFHRTLEKYIKTINNDKLSLKDVIGDLVEEPEDKDSIFYIASKDSPQNKKRINYLFDNDLYDLPNNLRPNCHSEKIHSYVSMYGRLKMDLPAQTITSGFGSMGQGRYVHPLKKRVLTPHEAARIQGFPDYFAFDTLNNRGSLHRMIGNAVPPPVSATILSFFLKILNGANNVN